jgi:hypothetical protein
MKLHPSSCHMHIDNSYLLQLRLQLLSGRLCFQSPLVVLVLFC